MEGKFNFKSEDAKNRFISDKKQDIKKYKKLIARAESLIAEVQRQD